MTGSDVALGENVEEQARGPLERRRGVGCAILRTRTRGDRGFRFLDALAAARVGFGDRLCVCDLARRFAVLGGGGSH
jgi:hypothetical protein